MPSLLMRELARLSTKTPLFRSLVSISSWTRYIELAAPFSCTKFAMLPYASVLKSTLNLTPLRFRAFFLFNLPLTTPFRSSTPAIPYTSHDWSISTNSRCRAFGSRTLVKVHEAGLTEKTLLNHDWCTCGFVSGAHSLSSGMTGDG